VGIGTRYELGGAEFVSCWGPGIFLSVKPIRTGPRARLVSLKTCRSFPGGQCNGGIVLTILTLLASRVGQSRNNTYIPFVCLHVVLHEELHIYLAILFSIGCTTCICVRYTLKQQTINDQRHLQSNYDC
jgi:hypothetical protein